MASNEQSLIILGGNVRKARDKKGISQQELADLCDVSKRTIQRIEQGENDPASTLLKTICQFLEVSADSLLGLDVL